MNRKEIENLQLIYRHMEKAAKASASLKNYLGSAITEKKVNLAKVRNYAEHLALTLKEHTVLMRDYINSEAGKTNNKMKIDKKIKEMERLLVELDSLKKA